MKSALRATWPGACLGLCDAEMSLPLKKSIAARNAHRTEASLWPPRGSRVRTAGRRRNSRPFSGSSCARSAIKSHLRDCLALRDVDMLRQAMGFSTKMIVWRRLASPFRDPRQDGRATAAAHFYEA